MNTSPSKKPSIALAMIVKNEMSNLPKLLESISGCFDEIQIVDTGSTDGTVEYIMSAAAKEIAGCDIVVKHFKWCDSFSKARNYSFKDIKSDFTMWMDGDDRMSDKINFKAWKANAMNLSDVWLINYNYALKDDGSPAICFVRERVLRTNKNPVWQYDIHEGIIVGNDWARDFTAAWTVDHHRTPEDLVADKSRNIKILENIKKLGKLDTRLSFYLGKELFEGGRPHDAISAFNEALLMPDMAPHDKILAYQYSSYAAQLLGDQMKDEFLDQKNDWYQKSIKYCLDGLAIDINRAEFYVSIGDSYIKMNKLVEAIPPLSAAKSCLRQSDFGGQSVSPIFNFDDCYGEKPTLQLAKIYFNIGKPELCKKEAHECFEKYGNLEAEQIIKQVEHISGLTNLNQNQTENNDIIITCPPQTAYEFDEVLMETKGMGGSETALIEMARLLKKKTNRPVKVFNMRSEDIVAPSGVEYISNAKLADYLCKNKPVINIAWRHNIKLTNAKTYAWCHDLMMPTADVKMNFDKLIVLSEFHKGYIQGKQGIPAEKFFLSRNGIDPEKFKFERKDKDPNKVVWMSSPDRGLDRCILIMDELRKDWPDLKLSVYYGLENLYKYGLGPLADKLKAMMAERPWIEYKGFTEQSKMYHEVSDAVVWLHPANFIESFCITALEMLALGIFPVTRSLGALQNTLADASDKGMAILLNHGANNLDEILDYKKEVESVLINRSWENVTLDLDKHSWASIADEWIEEMQL